EAAKPVAAPAAKPPLGRVFDPEAQTQRELEAQRQAAAGGSTQWRAAGQGDQAKAAPVTPPDAPEYPQTPITPTPTAEEENAASPDGEAGVEVEAEASEAEIIGPSLGPPTEADRLAPIDELS